MKHQARTLIFVVLIAALLALAACGGSSSQSSTAPAEATATIAEATAALAEATATLEPATATPEAAEATEAPDASEPTTDTVEVDDSAEVTTSIEVTPSVEATASTDVSATTPVSTSAESFSDPFAYCDAIGTIDAPDARFTGPAVPESVANGLQTALKTDMPLDVLSNGTSWRCMDKQVVACYVGANLPCSEKGNVDKTPAQPLVEFCQQQGNENAETIPAVVTGHNTVYSWRCTDGKPEIVEQVFQVDAQGFISDIWYPISAQ